MPSPSLSAQLALWAAAAIIIGSVDAALVALGLTGAQGAFQFGWALFGHSRGSGFSRAFDTFHQAQAALDVCRTAPGLLADTCWT